MSVWTRYKFEKTRLDPSFQLNKPEQHQPPTNDLKTFASVPPSQELTHQWSDQVADADNTTSHNKEDESKNEQSLLPTRKQKNKTAFNQSKLSSSFLRHSQKMIFCPQCQNQGSPVNDPKAGRVTCTECGLVLKDGILSEEKEWREFGDSDKSGADPNRVGSTQHYLLTDYGDLSTKIDDRRLQNLQQSTINSNTSQPLYNAINKFRSICRAGLSKPNIR